MHPRNVFRVPLNFSDLSEAYPALQPYIIQLPSKGPTINFQDIAAQRRLTEALLHKQFKLSVSLPENRLCPPVPNRLNYVLWIEDILAASSFVSEDSRPVRGIDIGTGASAIYPLLGCRTNATWMFVATDIDELSLKYAKMNIENNNLSDRITLVKSDPSGPILPISSKDDIVYDFIMCNPPFYSDREEVLRSAEAKEFEPNAVCTGADVEMITPGGESAFVCRMVNESIEHGVKCRWYTSMLGKMSSLNDVVKALRDKKTRRWAIAWSFTDVHLPDSIARITNPSLQGIMPPRNSLTHACRKVIPPERLRSILWGIIKPIDGVTVNEGSSHRMESESSTSNLVIQATADTWSRAARRKKLISSHPVVPMDVDKVDALAIQLICRVEIPDNPGIHHRGRDESHVVFHWMKGRNRLLFESFASHVGRKIDTAIVAIDEEEPMSIA
ncbi:unnamed protein product [Somion occarium]|uniref:U6 small nuclear RNA (adenine-(43)-N(6))-methyltransferase n=1 Tax=Somion occarium TaxID=3059160 RepID=A0ABP1DLV9_9APHY